MTVEIRQVESPRRPIVPQRSDAEIGKINKLIARADKGDESALPALRQQMTPEEWTRMGDLAWQARVGLISLMSSGSVVNQEAIGRRVKEIREELAEPSDGIVETMLIDRVSSCWLSLHHAENMRNNGMRESISISQADWQDRRITHCHKRYLSSLKALAQVRRLLRPTIQVNIAKKQVNIAGGDMMSGTVPRI